MLTALKTILRSAARSLGVERAATAALIEEMWPAVVGDAAAAHSRIAGLRGSVLLAEAESGPWAQELSARRGRFIAEINRRLGDQVLTDIRFRQVVGPLVSTSSAGAVPGTQATRTGTEGAGRDPSSPGRNEHAGVRHEAGRQGGAAGAQGAAGGEGDAPGTYGPAGRDEDTSGRRDARGGHGGKDVRAPAEPALSAQEMEMVERAVEEIKDPEIRESARRAMISQLKWRRRHSVDRGTEP